MNENYVKEINGYKIKDEVARNDISEINQSIDTINESINGINTSISGINENIDNIEENIANKFNEINNSLTNLNDHSILYKGSFSNVNVDDYKSFGIYYFFENCTNSPANYFYCLVMGTGGDSVQIGMSVAYDNLYIRRYLNNAWEAWKTI